jgi:cytochrome P450
MEVPLRQKPPVPTSKFRIEFITSPSNDMVKYRELLDYITGLVEQRLSKPENDLISKLVVEQVSDPDQLSSLVLQS